VIDTCCGGDRQPRIHHSAQPSMLPGSKCCNLYRDHSALLLTKVTAKMEVGELHDESFPGYDSQPDGRSQSDSRAPESSQWAEKTVRSAATHEPTLRFVVLGTSVLSRQLRVAILDGYREVQFGRDVLPVGSGTPRIRLKEMEVSKVHAVVFWDAQRNEWAVVDMGSKHGTFLKSLGIACDMGGSARDGIRLSQPRTASIPRKLRHFDLLTIGSTTLQAHIHEDRLPCVECSPRGGDEIPLFPQSRDGRATPTLKRSRQDAELDPEVPRSREAKVVLGALRRTLLTRHDDPSPAALAPSAVEENAYMDRSARRRSLRPDSRSLSSGVSTPVSSSLSMQSSQPGSPRIDTPPVPAQPPAPLPETNIGHRLLAKQGWTPGTSLGSNTLDYKDGRIGLIEPLELSQTSRRAGLGLHGGYESPFTPHSSNWQEIAKHKRWKAYRPDDTS
jgi:hypothetical protein